MEEANNGALPDASAAPRANAISSSSGTLTVSDVAASSAGLIRATSTPVPTTYTPSGRDGIDSTPATMSTTSAAAVSSSWESSCPAHLADRPVGGVHHRQRRCVRFDEQHRGPLVADGAADRLPQRGRSQKRRNQHDVFELVGGQRIAQCRSRSVVGARHADGVKSQAGLDRALPGAQNRGDHLSGALIVEESWPTGKVSSSTIRPLPSWPSTNAIRTAAGAIEMPSTTSKTPPKVLRPAVENTPKRC
ncbi:hypothetical protein A4G28_15810 [Mycobacterium ostraviense]|uniref:Uncharacterized protein n=1 Tax=Mycobacterium ostraviense TaxID=2738409 RepID=A0A163TIA5_9MYCO|nr:hypothetical protein A4G28_15810 [Mycobacterium ostraviense]